MNDSQPLICALFAACLSLSTSIAAWAESNVMISKAKKDANGFLVHAVASPYQSGTTEIRILLPDRPQEGKNRAVLYVLPVEAGNGQRWGNGLLEVKKAGLHNKHGLICVAPTFSHLPWYCDHPSNAKIRQETYFTKVVVPFVERSYMVIAKPDGRLLVGFSKSGWGAYSLLLRYPDLFGKAAAWDSPMMMEQANKYGMGLIFGTQENFEKYRITSLLKARATRLRREQRLVLLGYGTFREHHQQAHALMTKLEIRHEFHDGPQREHHWNSGWLEEAVYLMARAAGKNTVDGGRPPSRQVSPRHRLRNRD